MNKIRVLFLSWQPILISSLLSLFSDDPLISVEAKSLANHIQQVNIERMDHDILVIDDAYSNKKEFFITDNIIVKDMPVKKIVFTEHHEIVYIKMLLKLGAKGIVSKYTGAEVIREAIIKVHRNEKYICEKILEVLFSSTEYDTILTKRKKEIVALMSEGINNKEIAEKLFISKKTVERHKEEIKKTIGVSKVKEILPALKLL